jgi:hypothetical protein
MDQSIYKTIKFTQDRPYTYEQLKTNNIS